MDVELSLDLPASGEAEAEMIAVHKIPEIFPSGKGLTLENVRASVYMKDKYLTSGVYTVDIQGQLYYKTKIFCAKGEEVTNLLNDQINKVVPSEVDILHTEILMSICDDRD